MVDRKEYLEKLFTWKDEKIIKVITGMRRCGKSTLLKMYQEKLIEQGIDEEQILHINFELLENEYLKDYKVLHQYILDRLSKDKITYIFLDEIQSVPQFEKVVDSIYIRDNVDVYITGSNAYLLSGELSTLLSGRYVEISILPLSFAEYLEMNKTNDKNKAFDKYMKYGGLPYVASLNNVEKMADGYLESIYETIVNKDIEERQNRKEKDKDARKINDIALLKNISRFMASSIGNPISIKSIADFVTSSGRKVSPNTISDYVNGLVEPFIFYPVERYDVQGKQLLKTNGKYYIVDLGLRRCLVSKSGYDLGFSLENVVYLELLRRGYKVYIGKVGTTEVDFVAEKDNKIEYYQVSASILAEETFNREMRPLKNIRDNYSKNILTLDNHGLGNYEGIEVVNVIDWLTKK